MIDCAVAAEIHALPLSRDVGAYFGSKPADSYAQRMLNDLATAFAEKVHQAAHFTYGQVTATVPMEFGFRVGAPSIRVVRVGDSALPEWVARIQEFCANGSEDEALKAIALTTSKFKADGRLAQLSAHLALFELKRLPDVVLVSLLRNTFSIRSHITYWNALLDQTERILQEREREPRKLLRGLKR